MPNGSFTAGNGLLLSDAVLDAGLTQTVRELKDGKSFIPRAVLITRSNNATEETAGYCTINCWLVGQNEASAIFWWVAGIPAKSRWSTGLPVTTPQDCILVYQ